MKRKANEEAGDNEGPEIPKKKKLGNLMQLRMSQTSKKIKSNKAFFKRINNVQYSVF